MFTEKKSLTNTNQSSSSMTMNRTNVESDSKPYENLRIDSLRHAQRCKEFYIKAYQANLYGMSAVALFYIHQANEEAQLMKNANRTACELLLQLKLEQYHKTQRLDLHDLHLDEALNLFKHIEKEFKEKSQKSIEIIIDDDREMIRSVMLAYLQQQNYK